MKRLLVITTVEKPGPVDLPKWIETQQRTDVLVLNPMRFEAQPSTQPTVRECLMFKGDTGLDRSGSPRIFFRAYNEEVRRQFHQLLQWGEWDVLVIDGVRSAIAIAGDHGLEIPRGMAWVVYRSRAGDRTLIESEEAWFQIFARNRNGRLRQWHRALSEKATEVVGEGSPTFKIPFPDLSVIET